MNQSRLFIVALVFSYFASAICLLLLGTETYWENSRIVLMIAYLPFWSTVSWGGYLAYHHLVRRAPEIRENLVAFGVNSVIFLGWVGVLLVQFSVFAPHA